MTPDDFIMVFAFVVGIPMFFATINSMHKRHIKFKEKQFEALGSETAEKAAQYAAQTERLEQRIRVMERIATDKGADLAERIEDLREVSETKELN